MVTPVERPGERVASGAAHSYVAPSTDGQTPRASGDEGGTEERVECGRGAASRLASAESVPLVWFCPEVASTGAASNQPRAVHPTVVPVLVYPDVRAAVAFLTAAFGFVERTRIGESHRAQMAVGDDGAVTIADVGGDRRAPTICLRDDALWPPVGGS